MSLAIMQAYFFPYIGYFQLINAVDTFILYEHVTYRKRSWINRNRILSKQKKQPIYITLPLSKQSSFKRIGEIQINQSTNWQKDILNQIKNNYHRAPYFNIVFPFIKELLYIDEKNLHVYNSKILIELCKFFDIDTHIIYQNSLKIENTLTSKTVENNLDKKINRIFEISKDLKINHIINLIGGKELYSKTLFKKNNIKIDFIATKAYKYNQFDLDFHNHLSIIDLMMHLDKNMIKSIISNYNIE